jgi:hypothetical protein
MIMKTETAQIDVGGSANPLKGTLALQGGEEVSYD